MRRGQVVKSRMALSDAGSAPTGWTASLLVVGRHIAGGTR
ncbi:protein of unknown function [Lactiplantibacillus plantarum]